MVRVRNWTGFVFLRPKRYVEKSLYWKRFNLHHWSTNKYNWDEDDWNGLKDFAQNPRETVEIGHGDCEDYALVAASWAVSRGKDVSFVWCFESNSYWPSHVACRADNTVYSSGDIYDGTSPEEYVEQSEYDWFVERKL